MDDTGAIAEEVFFNTVFHGIGQGKNIANAVSVDETPVLDIILRTRTIADE